jgi:hypothetical protein
MIQAEQKAYNFGAWFNRHKSHEYTFQPLSHENYGIFKSNGLLYTAQFGIAYEMFINVHTKKVIARYDYQMQSILREQGFSHGP